MRDVVRIVVALLCLAGSITCFGVFAWIVGSGLAW